MGSSHEDDEVLEDILYLDAWLDIDEVIGFTIPVLDDGSLCTETINLFIKGGQKLTIKKQDDIVEYLTKEFVNKQWN